MKVYWVDLNTISERSDLIGNYYKGLTSDEQKRYDGMTAPIRRQQFLVGRALIRSVCHQSPILTETGKPTVDKGYISLAHSGSYVLLAVDDEPVGIDIENTSSDRDFSKIAGRMGWNLSEPVRQSFYQHFTRYEADFKLGKIAVPLHHFYYSFNTFTICISLLKKILEIEFIKVIPFVEELSDTGSFFIREKEI